MGTRGAIGWRINKQDKVTYNHFDSYPTGVGYDVMDYIARHSDDEIANGGKVRLVDESSKPTPDDIRTCEIHKGVDLGVANQSKDDWYCLLRNAQGDLGKTARIGLMIDSHKFLADSLFCEWAYIVNCGDTKRLEIYKGFNQVAAKGRIIPDLKKGRYAHLVGDKEVHKDGGKSYRYGGVVLIREIPFNALRGLPIPKLQELCKEIEETAAKEEVA